MKTRHFLFLSFLGTGFAGWQRQKEQVTVQETLEIALSKLLQRNIHCAGCGRTDAGVHALNYCAHLDLHPKETENLDFRLGRVLPSDIHLKALIPMPFKAHAQRDALSRTYRYFIHFEKDPFLFQKSVWINNPALELNLLNDLAHSLTGQNDFYSFCKRPAKHEDTICRVSKAAWSGWNQGLVFEINANRFVKNMVRLLVGNMLAVATGKLRVTQFESAVVHQNLLPSFNLAPAEGLYLADVFYPAHFFPSRIFETELPFFPFFPGNTNHERGSN